MSEDKKTYQIYIDGFVRPKVYDSLEAAEEDYRSALRRCEYDARICEV